MPAPAIVLDLVERFCQHLAAYKQNSYNEEQLRIEFRPPMFQALGWDMDNTQGYTAAYKGVIHEDALRVSGVTIAPDYAPRRDFSLLGLLNSRLGGFYFRAVCAGLEGKNETYLRFFGQYLESFPVRTIDFTDPANAARHAHMVALVEQMLALHRRRAAARTPHEQGVIAAQIAATDRQIDRLVYELYGLTENEIKLVAGG